MKTIMVKRLIYGMVETLDSNSGSIRTENGPMRFKKLNNVDRRLMIGDFVSLTLIPDPIKRGKLKVESVIHVPESEKAELLKSLHHQSQPFEGKLAVPKVDCTVFDKLYTIVKSMAPVLELEQYDDMFALNDGDFHQQILNKILNETTVEDFNKIIPGIKSIINLSVISIELRNEFLNGVFAKVNDEFKYHLWLDYPQLELSDQTLYQVTIKTGNLNRQVFQSILNRFNKVNESQLKSKQAHYLKHFFAWLIFDEAPERFKDFVFITSCKEIDTELHIRFVKKVIEQNDLKFKKDILTEIIPELSYIDFKDEITSLLNSLSERDFIEVSLTYLTNLLKQSDHKKRSKHIDPLLKYLRSNHSGIELNLKMLVKQSVNDISIASLIKMWIMTVNKTFLNYKMPVSSYFISFDELILMEFPSEYLIKLWTSDIIDQFDENYIRSFFLLTEDEQRKFRKKWSKATTAELNLKRLRRMEPWIKMSRIEKGLYVGCYEYSASWKSIWFLDGAISICMNQSAEFAEQFEWDFSNKGFMDMYEYFKRKKIKELDIIAKENRIMKINGLDDLKEQIELINAEISLISSEKESGTFVSYTPKSVPINVLAKNRYLDILHSRQIDTIVPTMVLRKKHEKRGDFNSSWLITIELSKEEYAIIWESQEIKKSKGTHIFKCPTSEYSSTISKIKDFITENANVRSMLSYGRKAQRELKNELFYVERINHDNLDDKKWLIRLKKALPEIDIDIKNPLVEKEFVAKLSPHLL